MALLKVLTDPYASVLVAVYEPLVLDWLSTPTTADVLSRIRDRQAPRRGGDIAGGAAAPSLGRFDWQARASEPPVDGPEPGTRARTSGEPVALAAPRALMLSAMHAFALPAQELERRRNAVRTLLVRGDLTARALLDELRTADLPHLLGEGGLAEALSPLGAAHLYRQLYFDLGAGLGPFEQAFTVAPKEELEIVQESSRRESFEQTETLGTENTLEKSSESSTLEELSDHVQTQIQRDMRAAVAASAETSFAVWSASAQGSFDLSLSTNRSREIAATRTVSQTKKSSEILRKSYSLTVKSFTEFNERATSKRTLRNDTDQPVNFGLRRVLRTVRVKLQSLGPRLVWQLYVREPGVNLARSNVVMFRAVDASTSGGAPNAPPRPESGTETGTQTVAVQPGERGGHIIDIAIAKEYSRTYRAITVDSITDQEPNADSQAPSVAS